MHSNTLCGADKPRAVRPTEEPGCGAVTPDSRTTAVAKIAAWLRHLIDPDQVVELRALRVEKPGGRVNFSGRFRGDELDAIAREVVAFSGRCSGIYYTINPLREFRGQAPRLWPASPRTSATDADVTERRRLLIDIDPVKPPGEKGPATAAEHDATRDLAGRVREYLTEAGFPRPVVIDTGNGHRLVYRIHLPADDGGTVRRLLHHLAETFDGSAGTVDTTVFNAARIDRLPGGLNMKGTPTPDRPHRRARLLDAPPGGLQVTPAAAIADLAGRWTEPTPAASTTTVAVPKRGTRTRPTTTGGYTELTPAMEERARRWLDKVPSAVDGAAGSKPTLWAARGMVTGFRFSPADALALLLRYYNPRCQGPWSEADLARKVNEAVTRPSGKPDGWLLDDKDATVPELDDDGEPGEGDDLPTGAQIILTHFRTLYRPDFRRGTSIHCEAGGVVDMHQACALPDSALIDLLAAAVDAPTYKGGGVNRNGLPTFFRNWVKVAWGDLLRSLPEEDDVPLAPGARPSLAGEEFRTVVRNAMLSEIVLGDTVRQRDEEVTRTERRSLIDWCVRFAKPGPWKSIRSKKCWCKTVAGPTAGEIVLRVAIRHELFAQIKADRSLCEMTQNTFARRAARYGVGTSNRDNRPEGQAAVVLVDDFVADLSAGLPDDDEAAVGPEGENNAPAR